MPFKPKLVKCSAPARPRPSSTARGYDDRHRKLRLLVLSENPFCQQCKADWSVEAHHLRYPAESTADYLALCRKCHQEITKEQNQ